MDENELTNRLQAAAEAVDVRPDLTEIERGASRRASRRRWLTGVVAAMLVAGAGGAGFGLGHAAGEGSGDATASHGEPVAPPAPAATTDPARTPETATPVPQPVPESAPTSMPARRDRGHTTGPATVPVTAPPAAFDPAGQPAAMTLMSTRTLSDGLRVRLLLGAQWSDGMYSDGTGFTPQPWCHATQELRITVDGPDLVDVTFASAYSGLAESPIAVMAQRFEAGWADGGPLSGLIVQAVGDRTSATVRWGDGASDTAEFVDGYAVLVVDGADVWNRGYELDIAGAGGVETLTSADVEMTDRNPAWLAGCVPPPPALPDAGEQPEDPAAAEAALVEAFQVLWDRDTPRDHKEHLLDDWTGVVEAIEAVDTGTYAATAATAVHSVDELVFTSPTEAWFRYSITTDASTFRDRYGRAELVDGAWQFPRALLCQDLSLASAGCHPAAPPIYPPSWYEIHGPAYYRDCDAEGTCRTCEVFADGTEECHEESPATVHSGDVPAPTAPTR